MFNVGDRPGFRTRHRGTIPHWEADHAVYFVTFRLADSLPQSVLAEARDQVEQLERKLRERGPLNPVEQHDLTLFRERLLQSSLDRGAGACYLRSPRIAGLVQDALLHLDDSRYTLHAWCVMPNHVHLLFALLGDATLSRVMHSIKSFTGNRANRVLGRSGPFWQREYYDRIVRDEREFRQTVKYILDNPAKAGMPDWPFVGARTAEP